MPKHSGNDAPHPFSRKWKWSLHLIPLQKLRPKFKTQASPPIAWITEVGLPTEFKIRKYFDLVVCARDYLRPNLIRS